MGEESHVPTVAELARGQVAPGAKLAYQPYWWEAAPRPPSSAALPNEADVVIVGSGFTGLSAALTLLRRGRSAVVLERGVPGFGASTRNGGQIGSGNQKFRVKTLIALRGQRKAEALLREGVEMLAYIGQLVETEKIDCHFSRCGRFRAAVRPEHYEAMARDMEDLKRIAGVESFMVPRAEQRTEIGSDVFFGGSVLPGERRIIWGGRAGRLAADTSPKAFRHLARDMLHVFPALSEVPVTHVWDGRIGYTYDEVPHLGRTARGVHYAIGYCGTGVSRATYFGHKIALQVLGDAGGRTAFDDLAFPSFPVHSVAKQAVPVVETWYRIRDAANI